MNIKEQYNKLVRPGFVDNISRIGIDAVFSSARGDYLYYNEDKNKVFDFISGYGTGILGHNNPDVVECAKEMLDHSIVFQGQRSVRRNAAILATKLNELLKSRTGNSYVFQFANTGAEANEIALKHAFMEKEILDKGLLEDSKSVENILPSLDTEEERIDVISKIEHNKKVLSEVKVLIGMVDGFHGKTNGTLKISYASNLKSMLDYLNIRTVFISTNDIENLNIVSESLKRELYRFEISDGHITVSSQVYTPIIAYFAEPILGDGGVIELLPEFAQRMRTICDFLNVPLIFDEIQCGMGRTGKFLASEYLHAYADYYCFSKALGGAISKNSVCAIISKRFIRQFGFIHSSTFNEDDYSCGISCKVLDMLCQNDGEIMKLCAEKGQLIHDELVKVQNKYPELILEVRGKGLMQGFVIDNTLSESLKELTDIQYINLIEGYLFKYGYRVGTTLTSGAVIRLEPSAYIKEEEILKFMEVLSNLGEMIQKKEYATLVKEVTGREG